MGHKIMVVILTSAYVYQHLKDNFYLSKALLGNILNVNMKISWNNENPMWCWIIKWPSKDLEIISLFLSSTPNVGLEITTGDQV